MGGSRKLTEFFIINNIDFHTQEVYTKTSFMQKSKMSLRKGLKVMIYTKGVTTKH